MRVLLTGAAGFIGGHAYNHFSFYGDEILAIDKLTHAINLTEKIKNFIQIDISDQDLHYIARDFKPDIIVNFAAETCVDNSIKNSYDFVVSNVLGTTNLLDICNSLNIKICHVSSGEVYGPSSGQAFCENDKLNPTNPYSATMAAADLMIKAYHNVHKTPYIVVRPSDNYGPNQSAEKFIPKLLDCIVEGKKFPLYSEDDQKREWTYVSDTATIIRSLIHFEKSWNSTYNISSGVMKKNVNVIEQVLKSYHEVTGEKILACDVIHHTPDKPRYDPKYCISTKKIGGHLKIRYTSFESGIKDTVVWYLKKKCLI